MSKNEKLIQRFCNKPKDFTYDELKLLLKNYGYQEDNSGNGSRVKFYNQKSNRIICLHKPHPDNIVKRYVIEMVYDHLKEEELI